MTMSASALPFDDIRNLFSLLPDCDDESVQTVIDTRQGRTAIMSDLGHIDFFTQWCAGWQGQSKPHMQRPLLALFIATHGRSFSEDTLEARLQSIQPFMDAYQKGDSIANQLCATHDFGLKVFDLALDLPTDDITKGAAMDEKTCAATIAYGMECIAGGTDFLCLGDLPLGNELSLSCLFHAIFGGSPNDWLISPPHTSPSQPSPDALNLMTKAMACHNNMLQDSLEILRRLGGREIAALMGAILAARLQRIPVVLDGLASTAAAALLFKIEPTSIQHCLFASTPAHSVMAKVYDEMNVQPVLPFHAGIAEGSAAVLVASLIQSSLKASAALTL